MALGLEPRRRFGFFAFGLLIGQQPTRWIVPQRVHLTCSCIVFLSQAWPSQEFVSQLSDRRLDARRRGMHFLNGGRIFFDHLVRFA